MHRTLSILFSVIFIGAAIRPALALPDWQTFSKPGRNYELKCAASDGTSLFLGGGVSGIVGPWQEPVFGDGFLTRLGADGQVRWEKEFGTPEGGESVNLVAVSDSKLFIAGFAACELESAWKGKPQLDWSQECYLARTDKDGRLEKSVRLSAKGTSSAAIEPYFLPESLVASPDGQLYLGATFRGKFGHVDTMDEEFGRGVLLHFDADLNLLETIALEGNSLHCLSYLGKRLLGAGTKSAVAGREMGPSQQKPVLWDLTVPGHPKQLWEGTLAENSRCLQLAGSLLYSNNETDSTLELDVDKLQHLPSLPPGVTVVTQTGAAHSARLAGGYRTQPSHEAPSTVCWILSGSLWKQLLVEELAQWNRLLFLIPNERTLTLLGTIDGPSPGERRWCCRQISKP